MKKTNQKITRYEHGDYYIDIVENEDSFEAWITGKKYGTSELMYGSLKKQPRCIYGDTTRPIFLEMVENSLHFDNYIEDYEQDMEDMEEMYNRKFFGSW